MSLKLFVRKFELACRPISYASWDFFFTGWFLNSFIFSLLFISDFPKLSLGSNIVRHSRRCSRYFILNNFVQGLRYLITQLFRPGKFCTADVMGNCCWQCGKGLWEGVWRWGGDCGRSNGQALLNCRRSIFPLRKYRDILIVIFW